MSGRETRWWLKETPPATLTDIQRAARFFYLQKLAFGGKGGITDLRHGDRPGRLNLLRMEEDLSAVHLWRHQVTIERLDWAACVERYDRSYTLFYLDLPDWGTEGYDVPFGLQQYARMAGLLKTIKGRAVVSVNDIPEMRQAFAGLKLRPLSITYSVGSAENARRRENWSFPISDARITGSSTALRGCRSTFLRRQFFQNQPEELRICDGFLEPNPSVFVM
ncbi:hypothetical protein [Variovorax paradoxus]|uniref:hypothetical protein n=1 Tax=Variovorax paradoxus TaxID=34073 RepID=UPI003D65E14B